MPQFLSSTDGTKLHYTDDGGSGRPLVLIHGWPLSGEMFTPNLPALRAAGYRVITYDRRGFGRSDKPESGYEYDTMTADLNDLLVKLDLRGAVLLGFSMGGGEVARYCGRYGTKRLAGVVLSGSICPALCISPDNPDGAMPLGGFRDMALACQQDHAGFLDQFVTWFYSNNDGLCVDEKTRKQGLAIALQSDPNAAVQTILSWATDLRAECSAIDVPVLLIHGDGDQNVPIDKSSRRAAQQIPDAKLVVIPGGPHGVNVSHREAWEAALLGFLAEHQL